MLTALKATMIKELRQTFRDKRTAALLIVAPLFQLILLGFAVNLEISHLPTVVADLDLSAESREFADDLLAGDSFDDAGNVDNGPQALEMIASGEASAALIIPRGFAADLQGQRPTTVQVLVDGSDSNRGIFAQNAITAYTKTVAFERLMQRPVPIDGPAAGLSRRPALLTVEPRILYNPTLNSHHYFVPGVAATLLLLVTMIVTAMGLAREKEAGTMEQVMVTPMSPLTIIFGKTLPYALIAMVDLGLVIAGGMLIFGVPLRGHIWVLALGGALYILTTLGLGLLISTVAKSQQQSFMVAFFVMLPAILLSGFMTPIANMPTWLQKITPFNPVRHFVEVMRAVMLKGATAADLAPQLMALAGIGIVVFSLALLAMRRSLS